MSRWFTLSAIETFLKVGVAIVPEELVSLEVEIPESLRADIGAYLDSHPGMSFDEFIRLSVSSYLSAVSPNVYCASARAYLECLYGASQS